MKLKLFLFVSLLSLGLLLALSSHAQMIHDLPAASGQFQRIEQPLWTKAAVAATGLSLIALELWWFWPNRSKPL